MELNERLNSLEKLINKINLKKEPFSILKHTEHGTEPTFNLPQALTPTQPTITQWTKEWPSPVCFLMSTTTLPIHALIEAEAHPGVRFIFRITEDMLLFIKYAYGNKHKQNVQV